MNRKNLAIILLNNENHPSLQIPLLLKMNEDEIALNKAINSNDTDLIYSTLILLENRICLKYNNNIEYFYKILINYNESINLLKIYHNNKITFDNRTKLHTLLMYFKLYYDAAIAAINQAYLQKNLNNKIIILKESITLFNYNKEYNYYKNLTEEEIELIEIQKIYELHCNNNIKFLNKTLLETIEILIYYSIDNINELKWCEMEIIKLIKKFKFSEKSLWYMKIECYSNRGNWENLLRLAQEKKSPVGYKPFARACIE